MFKSHMFVYHFYGKLHRENGAINFAIIEYYENGQILYEEWYKNDKLHMIQ